MCDVRLKAVCMQSRSHVCDKPVCFPVHPPGSYVPTCINLLCTGCRGSLAGPNEDARRVCVFVSVCDHTCRSDGVSKCFLCLFPLVCAREEKEIFFFFFALFI